MASGPDQSDKLNILDGDNGSISLDSLSDWLYNQSISIVRFLDTAQSHTS